MDSLGIIDLTIFPVLCGISIAQNWEYCYYYITSAVFTEMFRMDEANRKRVNV